MIKETVLLFSFFLAGACVKAQENDTTELPWLKHGRVVVAKQNPHFLSYEDGTPFFWLGDTGWEMLHLLTREEISYYLQVRKTQGFNVIQTVAISEFDGLTKPNAYGSLPLLDKNPNHPAITRDSHDTSKGGGYDYWDHVDFAINAAEKLGLYIALLPCWGEYVVPRQGNNIFHTVEEAYNYGNFIGNRYKEKRNIIWILGGDRLPDEIKNGVALWRAMAKGIADGTNGVNDFHYAHTDYSTTLMTYHCSQSSSKWYQNDEWLDMDMWGSYHDNYGITKAFEQVYADYKLLPAKPTINGEPAYEDHPVNWLPGNGSFTSYDVRQIAYWSVFAGACGHTYGCNGVWQFYDEGRSKQYFATKTWKQSLNDEGANQLKYLKRLIQSRPPQRRPANDIVLKGEGTGNDHAVATMGDGYAFVYLPTGRPVTITLDKISKKKVNAYWYDPRTGEKTLIAEYSVSSPQSFAPPGISKELTWLKTGRGCDWVLVIDDVSKQF